MNAYIIPCVSLHLSQSLYCIVDDTTTDFGSTRKERKGNKRKGKDDRAVDNSMILQNFATCCVVNSNTKKLRILRRLPRLRIQFQLYLLVVPTSGNIVQRLQTSAKNERLRKEGTSSNLDLQTWQEKSRKLRLPSWTRSSPANSHIEVKSRIIG
jgi:hypothetical protein